MNDECCVYEFSVSALNEVGEGKMSDPVISICSGVYHRLFLLRKVPESKKIIHFVEFSSFWTIIIAETQQ